MAQIRITPQELRDGAAFVENKLAAITEEAKALKAKIDEVAGNWEGAAQSSFIQTFEANLYPVLSTTVPEVANGIAAQLRGAANAIEEADNKVAEAFRG